LFVIIVGYLFLKIEIAVVIVGLNIFHALFTVAWTRAIANFTAILAWAFRLHSKIIRISIFVIEVIVSS
jgi:hypothetical protein